MEKVDALILAGGTAKNLDFPLLPKGLVEIKGRPMVEYVVKTLMSCSRIGKIAVVTSAPEKIANLSLPLDEIIFSNGPLIENIEEGLKGFRSSSYVLLVSSDIPLINSKAISDFLSQCEKIEADVYYPIIPKESVERKFPEVERTYFTLDKEVFTGGNLVLVKREAFEKNVEWAKRIFASRKSPLRMVRLLGLVFLFKFLARRLTLREVETKSSSILRVRGRAVVTSFPEMGVDVDKASDLEVVTKLLSRL